MLLHDPYYVLRQTVHAGLARGAKRVRKGRLGSFFVVKLRRARVSKTEPDVVMTAVSTWLSLESVGRVVVLGAASGDDLTEMVLKRASSSRHAIQVVCVNRPTAEFAALRDRWSAHPLVGFVDAPQPHQEASADPTSTVLWRRVFGSETSDGPVGAGAHDRRTNGVSDDWGPCDCVLVLETGLVSEAWLKGHDSPPEFCAVLKMNSLENHRLACRVLEDGRYVLAESGHDARDGYLIARRRMRGRTEVGISGILDLVESR